MRDKEEVERQKAFKHSSFILLNKEQGSATNHQTQVFSSTFSVLRISLQCWGDFDIPWIFCYEVAMMVEWLNLMELYLYSTKSQQLSPQDTLYCKVKTIKHVQT